MCADKAYDSGEIHNAMLKKGIKTLIPQRSLLNLVQISKQILIKLILLSMEEKDTYYCPNGKEFHFSTFKKAKALRHTNHKKGDCDNCPFYDQCMGKSKNIRSLEVHLHERARKEQSKNIGTVEYIQSNESETDLRG